MENQNWNDPSKEQVANDDDSILDDSQEPLIDEHQFKEETAAEITEHHQQIPTETKDERPDVDVKNVFGWIAIALSIVSFFIVPLLFAGAGIILGIIARNREAPILGNTAIVVGILSILIRLFIVPLI